MVALLRYVVLTQGTPIYSLPVLFYLISAAYLSFQFIKAKTMTNIRLYLSENIKKASTMQLYCLVLDMSVYSNRIVKGSASQFDGRRSSLMTLLSSS